jgi:hypothetical protein
MEIREKARKIYEIRGRYRKILEQYTEIDSREMQKDLWVTQDRRYKEIQEGYNKIIRRYRRIPGR